MYLTMVIEESLSVARDLAQCECMSLRNSGTDYEEFNFVKHRQSSLNGPKSGLTN